VTVAWPICIVLSCRSSAAPILRTLLLRLANPGATTKATPGLAAHQPAPPALFVRDERRLRLGSSAFDGPRSVASLEGWSRGTRALLPWRRSSIRCQKNRTALAGSNRPCHEQRARVVRLAPLLPREGQLERRSAPRAERSPVIAPAKGLRLPPRGAGTLPQLHLAPSGKPPRPMVPSAWEISWPARPRARLVLGDGKIPLYTRSSPGHAQALTVF